MSTLKDNITLIDYTKTLDIGEIIARWDEIIGRTEAGESFIISVEGEPKVRMVPISPKLDIDHGPGLLGSMREDAEILDQIVADAMRSRQIQAWHPSQEDFEALEAIAAKTNRPLQNVLNEAVRLLIRQRNNGT